MAAVWLVCDGGTSFFLFVSPFFSSFHTKPFQSALQLQNKLLPLQKQSRKKRKKNGKKTAAPPHCTRRPIGWRWTICNKNKMRVRGQTARQENKQQQVVGRRSDGVLHDGQMASVCSGANLHDASNGNGPLVLVGMMAVCGEGGERQLCRNRRAERKVRCSRRSAGAHTRATTWRRASKPTSGDEMCAACLRCCSCWRTR